MQEARPRSITDFGQELAEKLNESPKIVVVWFYSFLLIVHGLARISVFCNHFLENKSRVISLFLPL